ncbi:MAG: DUF2255 family protein [Paracoccaceae bacterium]
MPHASLWDIVTGLPRLIVGQALHPLSRIFRGSMKHPESQAELADLVNKTRSHQIRAGYTHRFIQLMFVAAGDRVFCRRYQYNEPSWHSVFLSDPGGQVRLDGVEVNITATVPHDMEAVMPFVDQAYADALKKLGASFMLAGAVEPRAQQSTLEIKFSEGSVE